MRQLIYRAMHQSDDLVVTFDYCDSKGVATHRVVSPIRFLGKDRFLALCLSRASATPVLRRLKFSSVGPDPEPVLFAASVVNAILQVGQGHEYLIKACRLDKIHVPHRLVVTSQCRQPLGWRDDAKGSGFG